MQFSKKSVERFAIFSLHPVRWCQVESVHLSLGEFYFHLGSWYCPQGMLYLGMFIVVTICWRWAVEVKAI